MNRTCSSSDEATSALDPETTHTILTLLRDINRQTGVTVVMITHQMEVVREVCDRVAVLSEGQIVEMGSAAEIFAARATMSPNPWCPRPPPAT